MDFLTCTPARSHTPASAAATYIQVAAWKARRFDQRTTFLFQPLFLILVVTREKPRSRPGRTELADRHRRQKFHGFSTASRRLRSSFHPSNHLVPPRALTVTWRWRPTTTRASRRRQTRPRTTPRTPGCPSPRGTSPAAPAPAQQPSALSQARRRGGRARARRGARRRGPTRASPVVRPRRGAGSAASS